MFFPVFLQFPQFPVLSRASDVWDLEEPFCASARTPPSLSSEQLQPSASLRCGHRPVNLASVPQTGCGIKSSDQDLFGAQMACRVLCRNLCCTPKSFVFQMGTCSRCSISVKKGVCSLVGCSVPPMSELPTMGCIQDTMTCGLFVRRFDHLTDPALLYII